MSAPVRGDQVPAPRSSGNADSRATLASHPRRRHRPSSRPGQLLVAGMTLVLVAAVVPGALADTEGDLASAQAPDTPAQVETGAEAGGASGTPSPPEAPASGGNT